MGAIINYIKRRCWRMLYERCTGNFARSILKETIWHTFQISEENLDKLNEKLCDFENVL